MSIYRGQQNYWPQFYFLELVLEFYNGQAWARPKWSHLFCPGCGRSPGRHQRGWCGPTATLQGVPPAGAQSPPGRTRLWAAVVQQADHQVSRSATVDTLAMWLHDPWLYTNCVFIVCRCLIECRDEYKYNVEAVELLIRNHLVNMQQYDLHLAQVCNYELKRAFFFISTFIFLFEFCIALLCFWNGHIFSSFPYSPWRTGCTTWQWRSPCSWWSCCWWTNAAWATSPRQTSSTLLRPWWGPVHTPEQMHLRGNFHSTTLVVKHRIWKCEWVGDHLSKQSLKAATCKLINQWSICSYWNISGTS